MTLVDTSVIADIFTRDPDWFKWSSTQIQRAASQGPVAYDPVIFAELAVKFDTQKELEHRLSAFTYLPLPLNAAFQAGKAFEKYQAVGRQEGASAAGLLYRSTCLCVPYPTAHPRPRRVRTFFPSVRLIVPDRAS